MSAATAMRAMRLKAPGDAGLDDVAPPVAKPDEVLLKVLAAGLCQTDLHICSAADSRTPDGTTLGHEIAGEIVAIGAGVGGWRIGDCVIVHPSWSCGMCSACVAGRQNACRATGGRLLSPPTPGVTVDGGMAQYCAVPARTLVAVPDLDPAEAATLTDAALTAYHAIASCGDRTGPGTATVVVGLGGLGNMAVQILRATTATRIVIVDSSDAAIAASKPWSDLDLCADLPDLAERIVAYTDGIGADTVLDFVGIDATMFLAADVVARYGAIRIVGLNGGSYPFVARSAGNRTPRGVTIMCPYGGTYGDLAAVVALATQGRIKPMITRFPLEQVASAMIALAAGEIRGRAVLIP